MSHYTVAVFTRKMEDLELSRMLEPYNECLEVPHYITKDEIIRDARKNFEEYRDTVYADYLKNPDEYLEKCTNEAHKEYISKEFPKRLSWSDEDFYKDAIKWVDEKNIMPDGSIFDTSNPKAKWDWWDIGGRWYDLIPGNTARIGDIKDSLPDDFTTYAVITPDGEWHAPGDMGWFGCSTESKQEWQRWAEQYKSRFIDAADPSWFITIVDCHI